MADCGRWLRFRAGDAASGTLRGLALAAVCATLTVGCSSTEAGSSGAVAGSAPPAEVTMINGEIPPGVMARTASTVAVVDDVFGGLRTVVYRDLRTSGTRPPIHVHPHGGTLCVISGAMTSYQEGFEPRTVKAGDCIWMRPGVPMTSVAVGDVVMLDSFTLPPGEPVWQVVEPGAEAIIGQFDGSMDGM